MDESNALYFCILFYFLEMYVDFSFNKFVHFTENMYLCKISTTTRWVNIDIVQLNHKSKKKYKSLLTEVMKP